MLDEIINKLEENVGTDDFEYIMEECIAKLEIGGAGIEAVTPLLQLMERHPLDDFGMPGAIVHFVERFYKNGYEQLLVESIKRRPAMHTVWMLNRIKNGCQDKTTYIELLKGIAENPVIEEEIRNSAKEFSDA